MFVVSYHLQHGICAPNVSRDFWTYVLRRGAVATVVYWSVKCGASGNVADVRNGNASVLPVCYDTEKNPSSVTSVALLSKKERRSDCVRNEPVQFRLVLSRETPVSHFIWEG